jgi:hypothetical protein
MMDKVWLPFTLLVAVWGTFDVVLKTIDMQNKTRDSVRDKPREFRLEIYRNDWRWLWLGSIWFLAMFTVVIASTPWVLDLDGTEAFVCWCAASMPGFALLGVAAGGYADKKVFLHE